MEDVIEAKAVKKHKKNESDGLWLTSFSDMSLILLSFFVLLYSMSTVDQKKFDHVQEAIKVKKPTEVTKESLEGLKKNLEKAIKARKLDEFTELRLDVDGLQVELKDRLLFAPGSDKPNQQYKKTVEQVLKLIAKSPDRYQILIEGHTDDTPLGRGAPFKSNWELSSARGISILRHFEKLGVKEGRTSVISYAHTNPKKDITGLTGEALKAARSANRRVVIRLEIKPDKHFEASH